MKIFRLLVATAITISMMSCSHPKQFSSCGDIPRELNGTHYDDLVKEWGEPYQKEVHGDTWYVKWRGIGVNGVDKEMMFDTNFITTVEYPSSFKGVECN